jgi:hypothetical protein
VAVYIGLDNRGLSLYSRQTLWRLPLPADRPPPSQHEVGNTNHTDSVSVGSSKTAKVRERLLRLQDISPLPSDTGAEPILDEEEEEVVSYVLAVTDFFGDGRVLRLRCDHGGEIAVLLRR